MTSRFQLLLLFIVSFAAVAVPVSSATAGIVYSQDFSASNPVDASGTIATIADGTLFDSAGQNITGGDAAAQATNGDYTIDLIGTSSANGNGFIFNAPAGFVPDGQNGAPAFPNVEPGDGFAGVDIPFTFTTGLITFDDQGTSRSGTVSINASAFNVGGEYLSLNLIQIEENDATGEVLLTIDYDAFGDFEAGGNENISVTTSFGASAGELSAVDIETVTTGGNQAIAETFVFQLVAPVPVPEPSSLAILSLGAIALCGRRRR